MNPATPRIVDPRVLAQAVGQEQTMAVMMERRFRRRISEEFRDFLNERVHEDSSLEDVEEYCIYYARQMEQLKVFEALGIRGYHFRGISDKEAVFYFHDLDKKQVMLFHFSWTNETTVPRHPHT